MDLKTVNCLPYFSISALRLLLRLLIILACLDFPDRTAEAIIFSVMASPSLPNIYGIRLPRRYRNLKLTPVSSETSSDWILRTFKIVARRPSLAAYITSSSIYANRRYFASSGSSLFLAAHMDDVSLLFAYSHSFHSLINWFSSLTSASEILSSSSCKN